jgi:hypothetical protein
MYALALMGGSTWGIYSRGGIVPWLGGVAKVLALLLVSIDGLVISPSSSQFVSRGSRAKSSWVPRSVSC